MLALLACAGLACAHAIVLDATPPVNATVPAGPLAIRLDFNSRIDAKRSRLALRGPDGSDHVLTIDLTSPEATLTSRTDVAEPGAWTVRWQVLSVDGHITRGEIPFTVRPAGPAK